MQQSATAWEYCTFMQHGEYDLSGFEGVDEGVDEEEAAEGGEEAGDGAEVAAVLQGAAEAAASRPFKRPAHILGRDTPPWRLPPAQRPGQRVTRKRGNGSQDMYGIVPGRLDRRASAGTTALPA